MIWWAFAPSFTWNAQSDSGTPSFPAIGPAEVQDFCAVDDARPNLLKTAIQQMNLSARSYHRVLKVSRTIADLARDTDIQTAHVARHCSIGHENLLRQIPGSYPYISVMWSLIWTGCRSSFLRGTVEGLPAVIVTT